MTPLINLDNLPGLAKLMKTVDKVVNPPMTLTYFDVGGRAE